jgi:hypothetical protein
MPNPSPRPPHAAAQCNAEGSNCQPPGIVYAARAAQEDGSAPERMAEPAVQFRLDPDPIQLNRIRVQIPHLSMILSENRGPLFGIVL